MGVHAAIPNYDAIRFLGSGATELVRDRFLVWGESCRVDFRVFGRVSWYLDIPSWVRRFRGSRILVRLL